MFCALACLTVGLGCCDRFLDDAFTEKIPLSCIRWMACSMEGITLCRCSMTSIPKEPVTWRPWSRATRRPFSSSMATVVIPSVNAVWMTAASPMSRMSNRDGGNAENTGRMSQQVAARTLSAVSSWWAHATNSVNTSPGNTTRCATCASASRSAKAVARAISGPVLITTGSFGGIGKVLLQFVPFDLDGGDVEPLELIQKLDATYPGELARLTGCQLAHFK